VRGPLVERHAPAVVGAAALAGAHEICNLLFRCGCRGWSTAHCNVHHTVGPRCPFCTEPWHFALAIALWLAAAAGAAALARRWWGRRAPLTLAAALVGLAVGALASGALTVALTGYPHLLAW
jgi:hypothetical protein